MVVFTSENRGGSAQHATRATTTRSCHGGDEERSVKAVCDVCAARGDRAAVGVLSVLMLMCRPEAFAKIRPT